MKFTTTLLLLFLTVTLFAQVPKHKRAYQIYSKKGRKVSYRKMIKKIAKADIVLFGELHNNPIAHWLELSIAQALHKKRDIIIGTEMVERDNQSAMNQYLAGKIDQKALDTLAVKLPSNYKTDYKPMVDFAKENNLQFICSNVPRRFASKVYREGFDVLLSLSDKEKSWIAPLPIAYDANLPGYQKMLEMMGGHGGTNLPKAQAIKDATMAHFILQNFKEEYLFFHFNGSFHSDNFDGIVWYLKRQRPKLNIMTISVVNQSDITKLEKETIGIADFIIVVDDQMTTTY